MLGVAVAADVVVAAPLVDVNHFVEMFEPFDSIVQAGVDLDRAVQVACQRLADDVVNE